MHRFIAVSTCVDPVHVPIWGTSYQPGDCIPVGPVSKPLTPERRAALEVVAARAARGVPVMAAVETVVRPTGWRRWFA